jgi:enoyl-[acyl-carrier-protein] reductase (NADH)
MGFKIVVVRFSTVQEIVKDFLADASVKELSKQVRKHLNAEIILAHSIHFFYMSQLEQNFNN